MLRKMTEVTKSSLFRELVFGIDTQPCVSCHVRTRNVICVAKSGESSYIFACQHVTAMPC